MVGRIPPNERAKLSEPGDNRVVLRIWAETTMNDQTPAPTKSRRQRGSLRRWLRRLGLLVLILLLLVVGLILYHRTIGGQRLTAAIETTDRLDPHWHWEDLASQRAPVPDDQNAAPVVLEAAKLLPRNGRPSRLRSFRVRRKNRSSKRFVSSIPRSRSMPIWPTTLALNGAKWSQPSKPHTDWRPFNPDATPIYLSMTITSINAQITCTSAARWPICFGSTE